MVKRKEESDLDREIEPGPSDGIGYPEYLAEYPTIMWRTALLYGEKPACLAKLEKTTWSSSSPTGKPNSARLSRQKAPATISTREVTEQHAANCAGNEASDLPVPRNMAIDGDGSALRTATVHTRKSVTVQTDAGTRQLVDRASSAIELPDIADIQPAVPTSDEAVINHPPVYAERDRTQQLYTLSVASSICNLFDSAVSACEAGDAGSIRELVAQIVEEAILLETSASVMPAPTRGSLMGGSLMEAETEIAALAEGLGLQLSHNKLVLLAYIKNVGGDIPKHEQGSAKDMASSLLSVAPQLPASESQEARLSISNTRQSNPSDTDSRQSHSVLSERHPSGVPSPLAGDTPTVPGSRSSESSIMQRQLEEAYAFFEDSATFEPAEADGGPHALGAGEHSQDFADVTGDADATGGAAVASELGRQGEAVSSDPSLPDDLSLVSESPPRDMQVDRPARSSSG
ncbi:hypothetical protein HK405_013118 [Cladochytrium tenue]|nr:hypothetical protein HK405_013118 [Cladochytrium tenue]